MCSDPGGQDAMNNKVKGSGLIKQAHKQRGMVLQQSRRQPCAVWTKAFNHFWMHAGASEVSLHAKMFFVRLSKLS